MGHGVGQFGADCLLVLKISRYDARQAVAHHRICQDAPTVVGGAAGKATEEFLLIAACRCGELCQSSCTLRGRVHAVDPR